MGKDHELDEAKRIMGALVRMPPKPHDEMKLGKAGVRKKKTKSSQNRAIQKKQPE